MRQTTTPPDAKTGTDTALVVQDLEVRYSHRRGAAPALHGVSFRLPRGIVAGVVGPDGAGKTTLLKCLAGLVRPSRGELQVFGRTWDSDRAWLQARVAYMPQTGNVYDNLTVRENLELFSELYGISRRTKPQVLERLLRISNLAPFPDRLARNLSGGMRQKLGLICCLVSEPDLLVLDEPGVGVDVLSRRELWTIYREYAAAGTTVVLSTTYMDEADQCDYSLVLDRGELLFAAPPAEFRALAADRVLTCRPPSGSARSLAARLSQLPGILDATVEGDTVRVLLAGSSAEVRASIGAMCPDVQPAAPEFGDAFALTLGTRQQEKLASSLPAYIEETPAQEGAERKPTVRVAGVWKYFGDFAAVRNVSFAAYSGEVFGLLGANGAGKTTLFRMLCGVLPPSRGELIVAGADAAQSPIALRRRIGYMAQKFALYRELTVAENISFYGAAYGVPRRLLRERVDQLLSSLQLAPFASARAGELPLGFKQRLSLACAIVHNPDIVFLDEPTSGVDPLARREFWGLINALAARGRTVLVTTHFMEEAEYCDRVIIMEAGEVIAEGNPQEITRRARQRDPEVRTFEDAFVVLLRERRSRES